MDGRPQRPPERWEDRPGGDPLGAGPGEQDGHGHPRPPEVLRASGRRGKARGRVCAGGCVCVAAGGGADLVPGGLSPRAGLRGGASVCGYGSLASTVSDALLLELRVWGTRSPLRVLFGKEGQVPPYDSRGCGEGEMAWGCGGPSKLE